MSLTYDIKELQNRWMKLYLNLFLLKSHNPTANQLLEKFKDTLAVFNEEATEFFDKMTEPLTKKKEE